MKKRLLKILTALLGTAGIGGGLYLTAVGLFCSQAFARKPLISFLGDGPELQGIAKEGEKWLLDHGSDVRTMVAEDGTRLKAHYIPAENAKRTLIEFHGWHGGWHVDFSASSPFFHERGCNLLIVEQRGQGASDGKYMTFGLKERKDVLAWVKWYQEQIDSEIPVYLAGISMGAATVLMAAAEDYPPQVKGIIADCGFTSAYEIIRQVGKDALGVPEHPVMDTIQRYSRRKLGIDLKEYSTLDAMRQATVPILFIHGSEDKFVPCEMTKQNYDACVSPKELLIVGGAPHAESFLVDTEAYLNAVDHFFIRNEK